MDKSVFESFDYEKMAEDLEPEIEKLKRNISALRKSPLSNGMDKSKRLCALEEMLMEAESQRRIFLKRAEERRTS